MHVHFINREVEEKCFEPVRLSVQTISTSFPDDILRMPCLILTWEERKTPIDFEVSMSNCKVIVEIVYDLVSLSTIDIDNNKQIVELKL